MNKQIITLVVCVAALVVVAGYAAHSFVLAGDCQKPSGNLKACAEIINGVSDCYSTAWNEATCKGKAMYTTPVNVPIGTTESDSGTTSTTMIDCVKRFDCSWTPTGSRGICGGEPEWDDIPYDKASKIIVGPNPCPNE